MRVIAVIDQPQVVEKILRHLGLWSGPSKAPPPTARCARDVALRALRRRSSDAWLRERPNRLTRLRFRTPWRFAKWFAGELCVHPTRPRAGSPTALPAASKPPTDRAERSCRPHFGL